MADHLARAIVDQSAREGLVFGIEGKWGSGKSSLLHLTIEALRTHGNAAPEIIVFSPWLIGDRDQLLRSLFDELASVAVKIDPIDSALAQSDAKLSFMQRLWRNLSTDSHWKLRQKKRLRTAISGKLKAFGQIAGTVGKLARAAGAFGVTGGEFIANAAERSGTAASQFAEGASVSKQKGELVAALKLLSRRIIVFIDDLDRLEPREANEVLRLIRAVADFPNVIYVLSYDPEVLAQTISKAVQIDDGAAFLEKVVQVSFRLPRPEAFDLRRWFQVEVHKMFSLEFEPSEGREDTLSQRLAQAIDAQGGRYLKTPRDVGRALNALRMYAVPVRAFIDISDMVWLQLVRIGNPIFYAWIEEYVTEVGAIATGARVTEGSAEGMCQRLIEILKNEELDVDRSLIELNEILPGIDMHELVAGDKPRRVFNLRDGQLDQFAIAKRLGSPHHYRYYFAFSHPSGSLPDEQVQAFIDCAEHAPAKTLQILMDLARSTRSQGGTMAEVLLDRLPAWSERIPSTAVPGMLAAFANVMDNDDFAVVSRDFGRRAIWTAARKAVRVLLRLVPEGERPTSLNELFGKGQALGWLTDIFRNEIFAHGLYGNRIEPEDQWLLTADEFEVTLARMLERYRTTPPNDLMRVPNLMSLLYAWLQGGDEQGVKAWVGTQVETDAGLLAFLSRIRSWAASSVLGIYYPIKRRDLEHFLDFDSAVGRVKSILENPNRSKEDRALANELLTAINQSRE